MEVVGRSEGMASGPVGPTVYSVVRKVNWVAGCVEPSGIWNLAWVPAGMSTESIRVPTASVRGVDTATWVCGDPEVTTAEIRSSLVSTTSRTPEYCFQKGLERRWRGRYPLLPKSAQTLPPPLATSS